MPSMSLISLYCRRFSDDDIFIVESNKYFCKHGDPPLIVVLGPVGPSPARHVKFEHPSLLASGFSYKNNETLQLR